MYHLIDPARDNSWHWKTNMIVILCLNRETALNGMSGRDKIAHWITPTRAGTHIKLREVRCIHWTVWYGGDEIARYRKFLHSTRPVKNTN